MADKDSKNNEDDRDIKNKDTKENEKMEDSKGMEDIEEYEMGEGGKDGHLIWIRLGVSMLEVDQRWSVATGITRT